METLVHEDCKLESDPLRNNDKITTAKQEEEQTGQK